MSDKINEAIKDIAVRHGVVLSKDDPVLILQTMNERLLEENRKAQQEMLAQLKEEMENISSQWKDDAKDKAEKVLNAALAGSKEAMAKLFQETTNQSVHVMKE
ncbi:TPA: conjugal transfer protein TraM, partial [Legionella pneumophila]|nr:conjugal transfer protein TraM [Legionella pneumophila]